MNLSSITIIFLSLYFTLLPKNKYIDNNISISLTH